MRSSYFFPAYMSRRWGDTIVEGNGDENVDYGKGDDQGGQHTLL